MWALMEQLRGFLPRTTPHTLPMSYTRTVGRGVSDHQSCQVLAVLLSLLLELVELDVTLLVSAHLRQGDFRGADHTSIPPSLHMLQDQHSVPTVTILNQSSHRDDLHSSHDRRGRVGPVGRNRDDADVAVAVAVGCMVCADGHQASILSCKERKGGGIVLFHFQAPSRANTILFFWRDQSKTRMPLVAPSFSLIRHWDI